MPTFWKHVITVLGGALGTQALPVFGKAARAKIWGADTIAAALVVLLGLLLSPALLLFPVRLFAWVFGPAWRDTGELARILAPLCFLHFIASPLSHAFLVTGRQNVDLWWQVTLLAVMLTAFVMPGSPHDNVHWYALGYSTLYLVYLHMSWQCSQNRLAAACTLPLSGP